MRVKRRLTAIILSILLVFNLSLSISASSDSLPSGWAIEDILQLQETGILRGDSFDHYQTNITRETYAYLVYKLVESYGIAISEIADLNMSYILTDCDDYYVIGLFKAGIITGYLDNTYRPSQPITRQEICTLYMKALEVIGVYLSDNDASLAPFVDTHTIGTWAMNSMVKCLNAGIINGISATQLSPLGYSTIEQALVIFNRIVTNDSIGSQTRPFQKGIENKSLGNDAGYGYYVQKNLLGVTTGIKQYRDYELVKEIEAGVIETDPGVTILDDIQVVNQSIYYINSDGFLSAYDLSTGELTRIDQGPCEDFVVSDGAIYLILDGDVYRYTITGDNRYTEKMSLLSGSYQHIMLYTHEGDETIYLLDDTDYLSSYKEGKTSIISEGVQSFQINAGYIYYIHSDQILYKQEIGGTNKLKIVDNAYDFRVCGYNLLYINQAGKLYNINSSIQTNLVYEGDLFGLALDDNYLEVTEMLVGDATYNHLIALFYTTEYFGY